MSFNSFLNNMFSDDRIYDQTDPSDQEHFDLSAAMVAKKVDEEIIESKKRPWISHFFNPDIGEDEILGEYFIDDLEDDFSFDDAYENQWLYIENGKFDD